MVLPEFKVWIDGWNGKDDPHTVFARDAKRAAEDFVEQNHAYLDYTTEQEVAVIAPDGTQTSWTVTVESVPHFSARRKSS